MLSRNAINMKTRPLALCHKTRPLPQNRQRLQNSAAAAKVTVQRHLEPPRLLAAGGAGSSARAAGDALVRCSLRARHLKHTTRPSCLESHITYSPTTNHYMRTDKADHYTRTDQPAAGSHRPAGCRPGSTDVQQPRAWRGTRGAPSGRTCGTAERRGERPLPCQNGSDALQGRPRKWSTGAPSLRASFRASTSPPFPTFFSTIHHSHRRSREQAVARPLPRRCAARTPVKGGREGGREGEGGRERGKEGKKVSKGEGGGIGW